MRAFVGIAVALAFVSVPAVAAEGAAKEDKIICKRDRSTNLGSNMRAEKRCMKQSEWKELYAHTRRELRSISERGNSPTPIPGAR
jgi:hypothetical protein